RSPRPIPIVGGGLPTPPKLSWLAATARLTSPPEPNFTHSIGTPISLSCMPSALLTSCALTRLRYPIVTLSGFCCAEAPCANAALTTVARRVRLHVIVLTPLCRNTQANRQGVISRSNCRMTQSSATPVSPSTNRPIITTSLSRNLLASQIIQPIPAVAATISDATSTV